jgi:hypothetical protein
MTVTPRLRLLAGTCAVATAMVMTTIASQSQAAQIHACYKARSGKVRIVGKKKKCHKGEKKLSWNTRGPAGRNGANGTNGTNGRNGTNGANGTAGAPGQPQTAITFSKTLSVPGIFEGESAPLFSLPEASVSAQLACNNVILNIGTVEAKAPSGSLAVAGMAVNNAKGYPPESRQTLVAAPGLNPTSFTTIATLVSNAKEENSEESYTNNAHLSGSITTPTEVVLIDAFFQVGPNPSACTARGVAFSIPR